MSKDNYRLRVLRLGVMAENRDIVKGGGEPSIVARAADIRESSYPGSDQEVRQPSDKHLWPACLIA